jgi:hypothetical protein
LGGLSGRPKVAKYYYTTSVEPKAVYHDNQSCEEGKKIEAKNRVDTDTIPAGRALCEEC